MTYVYRLTMTLRINSSDAVPLVIFLPILLQSFQNPYYENDTMLDCSRCNVYFLKKFMKKKKISREI